MNYREAKSHFVDSLERMETLESESEWEEFFEQQLALLSEHPKTYGRFAIIHCHSWIVSRSIKDEEKFDDAEVIQRVCTIAKRIFALDEMKAELTVWFCLHLFIIRDKEAFKNWWLQSYEDKLPGFTHEVYLLGMIIEKYFDHVTWASAFEFLEPCLDHKSDLVRAVAAKALSEIFKEDLDDKPPLLVLLDNLKTRELERPGIVGPFWESLNDWFEYNYREKHKITFDQLEWLLQIMENRAGEEPIHLNYKGVGELVCLLAGNDLNVLRRLLKLKAYSYCYDLSFDYSNFSQEFKELLIEMGNIDDDEMQLASACLLAYEYNYVHPYCESIGTVRRFDKEEVSIIMIYGKIVRRVAAAVHPKSGKLSDSGAWKWINNLLPPDDRQGDWEPDVEDDTITFGGEDRTVVLYGNVRDKIWDRVIIKTPTRDVEV